MVALLASAALVVMVSGRAPAPPAPLTASEQGAHDARALDHSVTPAEPSPAALEPVSPAATPAHVRGSVALPRPVPDPTGFARHVPSPPAPSKAAAPTEAAPATAAPRSGATSAAPPSRSGTSPGLPAPAAATSSSPREAQPRPSTGAAAAPTPPLSSADPPPAVPSATALAFDLMPSETPPVSSSFSGGDRGGTPAPETPAPTPVPPTPTPAPEQVLIVHEVRPGETLGGIAQRYGVSTRSLLANNAVVSDRDMLKIGLQLMIPAREGVLYFVRLGDTISEIAERHGVAAADIINFAPNRLVDANSIREGELILIPGGRRPAPPPPPQAAPTPAPTPTLARPAAVSTPAPAPRPSAAATPPASRPIATPARTPSPAPVRTTGWIWPVTGPISSYFGPSHPLGIDIDLYGRAGAAVVAARAGTVTFAGGTACCSYGYYVEIDHGDGWTSLYAHFRSAPPVRIGQRVAQGQVIGYAGSTGYSTGVHLHFEIRHNGAYVNPLGLLP